MRRRLRSVVLVLALGASAAQPAAAALDPLVARQWGLEVVGAPAAWSVAQGRGIVIAVVDSGVDREHEDLRDNLVDGRDFVDGGPPDDDCGHGTHVAGIAAAASGNGRGGAGIAPRARIMPLRVLRADGADCTGTTEDVVAAVRYAADHGADVINLSVAGFVQGLFGTGSRFGESLSYAWSKGSIPVVSAGNDFVFASGYGDEPALVVSATDRDDRAASYSNGVGSARWGIAAPGGAGDLVGGRAEDDILSTYWQDGRRDLYAYLSGTSMAAPFVSGAAALLRSLGLGKQATVDRLLSTAHDVGTPGPDATFGAGRLDVAAAVAGLGATRAPRPAPRVPRTGDASPRPRATASATAPAAPGDSRAIGSPSAIPAPPPAPADGPADPVPTGATIPTAAWAGLGAAIAAGAILRRRFLDRVAGRARGTDPGSSHEPPDGGGPPEGGAR